LCLGRLVGYMEDAIEVGKDRVDVERLGSIAKVVNIGWGTRARNM